MSPGRPQIRHPACISASATAPADLGDKIPDSASDAVETGKRAYKSGSDQIARQVGRQPIEALLLAGAIGYLVGWAANRS